MHIIYKIIEPYFSINMKLDHLILRVVYANEMKSLGFTENKIIHLYQLNKMKVNKNSIIK